MAYYLSHGSSPALTWFACLEASVAKGGLWAVTDASRCGATDKIGTALALELERMMRMLIQGVLDLLRAEMANAELWEAAGRFFAAAGCQLKSLLRELRLGELLKEAVLMHRTCEKVLDQVVWALFTLEGPETLLQLMRDPLLGADVVVVKTALWGLSHMSPESAEYFTRQQRAELAGSAERWLPCPGRPRMAAWASTIIGTMLNAKLPDADHALATNAIFLVDATISAHSDQPGVKTAGIKALVALTEGNCRAVQALHEKQSNVLTHVQSTMTSGTGHHDQENAARVLHAVFGVRGLVEALSAEPKLGETQQVALLRQIGWWAQESGDLVALLELNAVAHVLPAVQGTSSALAAAGIAALGQIAEFLIEHASVDTERSQALEQQVIQCIDEIVQRMDLETKHATPSERLYAAALFVLRNVSLRSKPLASRIAGSTSLMSAVEKAFESDYWDLARETLRQLLAALLFFRGLEALIVKLEKYPDAHGFQEAALQVLVDTAEYEEGSEEDGTVLRHAVPLAHFATRVLSDKVPLARNRAISLACAAIQLLGHVLAPLGLRGHPSLDTAQSITHSGIESLLATLKCFPKDAGLASEACAAIVAIADKNKLAISILADFSAGSILLDIMRRFAEHGHVLQSAAVALGALGGFAKVLDLLESAPSNFLVQRGGSRAIGELCRRGLPLASIEEGTRAQRALQQAQNSFAACEHFQLQQQIELTIGLLTAAVA